MAEKDVAWVTVVRDGAELRVPVGEPRISKAEDWVLQLLSAAILRHMQTGDVLPSQEEIGDALGISRVPVGKALGKLRDSGFVAGTQGAKWRVL